MPYPSYLHGSLHGSSGLRGSCFASFACHLRVEIRVASQSHFQLFESCPCRGPAQPGIFTIPLTIPFVFRDLQKKNLGGSSRRWKQAEASARAQTESGTGRRPLLCTRKGGETRGPRRTVAFLCPVAWLRSLLTHSHFALPLFVSNFRSESGDTEWGYSMGSVGYGYVQPRGCGLWEESNAYCTVRSGHCC